MRLPLTIHVILAVAVGEELDRLKADTQHHPDRIAWNWACDYAAQAMLRDAGFPIPAHFGKRFAGMSVDEIYASLTA